ncbi:MAG: ABC transporter ATP-binding protein [Propionibacteriaceae bacterium]|jgi:ABC-2 type transport system ATP-binding protein|nr:ABC transporter ATP-binding protein [Propionibacteriaceae bacterium]
MSGDPRPIVTDGLAKRYGRVQALAPLDLVVDDGSVVGYLGPNGAGKSTTINLLMGYINPTGGAAWLRGHPAGSREARRGLSYIPPHSAYWPQLTGGETLHFLARLAGGDDPAERRRLTAAFEFDPGKKVGAYSTGNLQKLAIIAALATRPRLLLCDEPSTGLDPVMGAVFREEVKRLRGEGAAVLLSSHTMEEVEAVCDRVLIINHGVIVDDGTIADLKHLRAARVTIRFAGPRPDLAAVAGVTLVDAAEDRVVLDVAGSQSGLFAAFGAAAIESVETKTPSLEEVFLSYYDDRVDAANGRT